MLSASVIIPSLDSPLIDQVVARVRQQTRVPVEIFVVGLDRVNKLGDRSGIRFVDTGHPISPAAARNTGARLATGDVLCFLDADCLAEPDWIERLLAGHERGEQVVGGGVSLPPSGYWTLCDNLAGLADFMEHSPAGARAHLPSLNFSIRRSLFADIGGFDERYTRPSGEDTDLSFRLRRRGHALMFDPRARVVHCPPRQSIRHMWAHFHMFGATYLILQRAYSDIIGRSLRVELARRIPWLAALAAPFLALFDSLLFYARNPALARYWYALAGIAAARFAWYMGLIFGADRHFREGEKIGEGAALPENPSKFREGEGIGEGAALPKNPLKMYLQNKMPEPQSPGIWTIIINWKCPDETCACLESLLGGAPPETIVVIDNGSRDGSAEQIARRFPEVTLLALPRNLGFAKAANLGIGHALASGAEAVLLLNNDTIVMPDTLARLADALVESDRLGVASAKVCLAGDPRRLWKAGGIYRDRRVIDLGANAIDDGQYDDAALDFVYGCAMLLRASMLRAVGGFDERFFMYYEDIDLCLRARAAGYDVGLAPRARILHHGSRSTSRRPALKLFHEARSRMLFFAKHLRAAEKPRFYFDECRYLLALTARHLLAGDPRGALAYARGWLSALIARPNRPPQSTIV